MASDIVGIDGNPTGNQKMGSIVVNLQGKNGQENEAHQIQDDRSFTLDIADIHDKFDDRFDDPRFYAGDTPS